MEFRNRGIKGGTFRLVRSSEVLHWGRSYPCCRWPCHSLRLQSHETAEVKAVKVDGVTIWCVRVGICQYAHKEPSGTNDNGGAEVRF